MVIEIAIICCTVWMVFGDYFNARAEVLHEQARARELDNDAREFGHGRNDEEGS